MPAGETPLLEVCSVTKRFAGVLAVDRVTNGQGGMPSFKGQLSEAQIEAVATFVSENAGK